MSLPMEIEILDVKLRLLPEKAVMHGEVLWVTDIHLGKVRHFRKSGIPIPAEASNDNFERLIALIQKNKPKKVLFMGDLFHSHYNDDFDAFNQTIKSFPQIDFYLIKGNHDILSPFRYDQLGLQVVDELNWTPFIFTHEPMNSDDIPKHRMNICGHVHPVAMLGGKGRQQLRIPCFYFNKNQGFLPAFGNFTGNYRIKPKDSDRVFLVVNNQVIAK